MTTLNIFKGYDNTLSFNTTDTQHKYLKDEESRAKEALLDLKTLYKLSQGNTLDFRLPQIPTKTHSKPHKRSMSEAKGSRFIEQTPKKPKELLTNITAQFLSKMKTQPKIKGNRSPFSNKNYKREQFFQGFSINKEDNQMSVVNFPKYLNFLNSEDHIDEIPTAQLASKSINSTNRVSVRNKSHISHKEIEVKNFDNTELNYKNEELSPFPRTKTTNIRRSIIVSEGAIMEKMNKIATKLMKNLKKLETLNNFNKIKTFNELAKLFNNNPFLKSVFFDSTGQELNPKLSKSFIAQSIVIYPSKFNRNPNENRIRYNHEGIKILEKLIESMKDFCFKKKLIDLKAGEKDIIDSQKALKFVEKQYFRHKNTQKLESLDDFGTTIEIPLNYNLHISKLLGDFEEKFGKLDKIKEKKKVVGGKVDEMMQVLCENFANINNKI